MIRKTILPTSLRLRKSKRLMNRDQERARIRLHVLAETSDHLSPILLNLEARELAINAALALIQPIYR